MSGIVGRRIFALTMFYGGWDVANIEAELWERDWRVPKHTSTLALSLLLLVYGTLFIAAVKWLFL